MATEPDEMRELERMRRKLDEVAVGLMRLRAGYTTNLRLTGANVQIALVWLGAEIDDREGPS